MDIVVDFFILYFYVFVLFIYFYKVCFLKYTSP